MQEQLQVNPNERIRLLESRYSALRDRILLVNQNMISGYKKIHEETRELETDLKEIKTDLFEIKEAVKKVAEELKHFAKKEEVRVLEKYVDIWNPIKFVTMAELEERLEKKHKTHHKKQSKNEVVNIPKENQDQGKSNILEGLEQFNNPEKKEKKEKHEDREEQLEEDAPSPFGQPSPQNYPVTDNQQPQQFYQPPSSSSDQLQEIAETIIEEKWQEFMSQVGDFDIWRDRVNREIGSVKQEVIRTQDRFNNLQKAVLGKVTEYNENILNVGTEMKALEKVFQKILEPLTKNIRDLEKVTKKLKK